MAFRTLTVGRGSRADIRLDDASVSRLHAELTLTSAGRCYLTDRNSSGGTRILRDGEWTPHRQGWVDLSCSVRFGECETVVADLLRGRDFPPAAAAEQAPPSAAPRRNAETGEIELQQRMRP